MKRIISSVFYLFLLTATANAENKSDWVSQFADKTFLAHSKDQPLPLITAQIPSVNKAQAYQVQSQFVLKRLNTANLLDKQSNKPLKLVGFKAGLTSKAGQQKFKTDGPVYGVLFAQNEESESKSMSTPKSKPKSKYEPQEISLSSAHKLMLETEIGFVVGETIDKPITSVAELKQKIKSVMPVIELPDLAFENLSQLKGLDIIAANVASNQYILGNSVTMPINFSLNEIITRLTYEQNQEKSVILTGKGSDASGNQWIALKQLVNHQLAQGYTLKPDQFLITGALGKMIPARIGRYSADFGKLGHIKFNILR